MKINFFKIVSIATAILFIYLTIQLLFLTNSFVQDLGLEPSEAASVLGRRAAMFMLGLSILMFSSRNLPHSNARQYICMATGLTFFGLSFMGIYEFMRGSVNSSIFVAVSIETIFWVSYGIILLKNRTQQKSIDR